MRGKKISFKEAQKKFKDRTDIVLLEDGYCGWKEKSKFLDLILNQEFWSVPYKIWKYKSSPLRKSKVIPYREAKKRFEDQGRTDIILLEEGYNCWVKKAKFLDLILNQEFWAIPSNVYEKKSSPLHAQKKREKTNLKKYGVKNPAQSKEFQEKAKQTNLKRYGAENPFQSSEIKTKIELTNLERYGVTNPFQSKEIKEKQKRTCLLRYDVENPLQSEKIKEKIRKTNLEKYGTEIASQSVLVRQKTSNRFIQETGEHLKDWLKKQQDPKPAYVTLTAHFPNEQISLSDLAGFLKNYRDYKSNLEVFTENLFDTKHFNQKPSKISSLYRPDFKLNDQIYLNTDGLYWHSKAQKGKQYHFNLRKEFEENGLRIFQFHENELLEKTNIVRSVVNNSLGKTPNKIYSRKCKIQIVPQKEATLFLNSNHLMGSITAKHIGLFYENSLVSLLSFKCFKNICKIERFCSLIDTSVVGSFSKLLKYLETNCLNSNITEVYNWVDLRYGTGNHLLKKGFKFQKETLGWKWTDGKTTFNRLKCRANMDSRKLTQQEYADELGWFKIYDAGQRLYVKSINA